MRNIYYDTNYILNIHCVVFVVQVKSMNLPFIIGLCFYVRV